MKSVLLTSFIVTLSQFSFADIVSCNLKAQKAAQAIAVVDGSKANYTSSSWSETGVFLVDIDGTKYSITASDLEKSCTIESIVRLK